MTFREAEAAIYAAIEAHPERVSFYQPTNAEWRERTGQSETMRASDRDYIYGLADWISGGRKSRPDSWTCRNNGHDGKARCKIIQAIARQVAA